MLALHPASAQQALAGGLTALHVAAVTFRKAVPLLLEAGAEADQLSILRLEDEDEAAAVVDQLLPQPGPLLRSGATPLFLAVWMLDVGATDALLRAGA